MQGKPRERCRLQPSEPPSSAPRSRSPRRQARYRRSVRRHTRRDDSALAKPLPSTELARENNVPKSDDVKDEVKDEMKADIPSPGAKIESHHMAEEMRCPLQPSEPLSSAPRSRSLRRQSRRTRLVGRDKSRDGSVLALFFSSAGLARQSNVGLVLNREVRPPSVPKDAIKDDKNEDEIKAEDMQRNPQRRCRLQPSKSPSSAPRSRSPRRQSRSTRSVRRDTRRDDSAFAEPSPSAGLACQNNVGSVTNREVRLTSVPKDAFKDDVKGENDAEEMHVNPRLQPSEPSSSARRSTSPRRQSRSRRSVRRDKSRDDSAFAEPSPSAGLARQNNVGSVTNRKAM